MNAFSPGRLVLTLAGPVLALLVAFVVTSLVLIAVGDPVGDVWSTLLSRPLPRQMVNIVNAASVFYISAIAVAVGFRMNLFNIGVDGQYRVAVFAATVFAARHGTRRLNIIVAILIAILCGGLWAGIAARSVKRSVPSHRRSLNAIATGLVSFLLGKVRDQRLRQQRHQHQVRTQMRGMRAQRRSRVTLILLAALVGFLWFVSAGGQLRPRATGMSETAAVANGGRSRAWS
jgi:simple sugar transport system permease protein